MFLPIMSYLDTQCTTQEQRDILVQLLTNSLIHPNQCHLLDAGQRYINYLIYAIPTDYDYTGFLLKGGKPGDLAEMFDTGTMVTIQDRLAYLGMKFPEGAEAAIASIQQEVHGTGEQHILHDLLEMLEQIMPVIPDNLSNLDDSGERYEPNGTVFMDDPLEQDEPPYIVIPDNLDEVPTRYDTDEVEEMLISPDTPVNASNETFREWMHKVDMCLQDRIGCESLDLPDQPYWDMWDEGLEAEEAAEGIISDLEDGSL